MVSDQVPKSGMPLSDESRAWNGPEAVLKYLNAGKLKIKMMAC